MAAQRDLRLDILRGGALVCICVDHIPQNVFAAVTLRNFALCDAAEVFVLVSGITAALGFGEVLLRRGIKAWLLRIAGRIAQLYVAHLGLIVVAAGLLWLGMHFTNKPPSWAATPFSAIAAGGAAAVGDVLLLRIQPELLDVLPLYIVLLALLPLVYTLVTLNSSAMLLLSGAVWLTANVIGTCPSGWYFSPYAWQFLFTIGVVIGVACRRGSELPRHRWLASAAATYVVFGVVASSPWAQLPGFDGWRLFAPDWMGPAAKSNLSAWRIGSVLAIAYLWAYFVPASARWLADARVQPILMIGRNGLSVLCVATIVDYAAVVARLSGFRGVSYQLGFNTLGIVALVVAAWVVERLYDFNLQAVNRNTSLTPSPPVGPQRCSYLPQLARAHRYRHEQQAPDAIMGSTLQSAWSSLDVD